VPAPTTSATSGPTSPDSFASVNPDGSWRKTCQGYSQVTLDGSLERYSETWPRAGMTRSGTAYRRVPSAPLTDATASGLLPTPKTPQGGGERSGDRAGTGDLMWMARSSMWPTPTQSDGMGGPGSSGRDGGDNLRTAVSGSLNPTWVEWLMGYPLGWTACAASATRSSHRSRNGSPTASPTPTP
jgi:hypothetical protein